MTAKWAAYAKPFCRFDVMTPNGNICLTLEEDKALLDGKTQFIKIGGVTYAAYELLDQEVTDSQTDLFDESLIRLKTEEPEETMTMSM